VSSGYYTTFYEKNDALENNYFDKHHLELEREQLIKARKIQSLSPVSMRLLSEASLHRTSQMICEPGSYCIDGVKYSCPAGTFGETSGLTTPGKGG
jgi:hypothetical protein